MVRLLLAQRGRADELDREQDATPLRLGAGVFVKKSVINHLV